MKFKKTLCAVLCICIIASMTTAFAGNSIKKNTNSSKNAYSSDWRYWSQGATKYVNSKMQSAGCRVVAQAKLLMETGVASDDGSFNPDKYIEWASPKYFSDERGFIKYIGEQEPQGTAPVAYAKLKGKNLSYVGQFNFTSLNNEEKQAEQIMSYINAGYYVIVGKSSHHAYIGRAESISAGQPIIYNSQSDYSYMDSFIKPYTDYCEDKGCFTYCRVYALDKENENITDFNSIEVNTTGATNITDKAAQLNGSFRSNYRAHITEHGAYLGTSTANMVRVARDVVNYNKSSLTMFYSTAKYYEELAPNTTYYYFQYVVADGDMIKGNTVSFKTLPDSRNIKVTTNPATEVTETSAQLNGTFSANATVHITEHGAYLGTSPESMTAVAVDKVDYNKSSLTMFYRTSKYCDGLVQPGTTYYFRQYVIADGTTYWGDVLTFTTPGTQSTTSPTEQHPLPPDAPYLHVSANTVTEGESVTIWWDAVPNSTEYDLNISYGSGGTIMPMIKDTQVELTDLAPGTYSAEGHASGEGGISPSSNVVTFTVNPKAQQAQHHVYTNPATNVTSNSAQLNGSFSSDSTPHMTEHGAYLGTNSGNMQKVAVDKVNYYKSSLTMFYSTSKYYGSLAPNTTYYFCQYAIIDGVEYRGNTLSFTTSKNTTTGVIKGTNGHLAINSKPSAGNQIGRIPEGATCEVDLSRTSGNWYWVTYNGVSGYAYKKYIILN